MRLRWILCALVIVCGGALGADRNNLSLQAQLGRRLFFEPALSASGALSCASCHDPASAYAAPPMNPVVMRGGSKQDQSGLRTVPSLRYLTQTPRFARHVYVDNGSDREDIGPAGGYMIDGRADTLREQALLPLLDPREMANESVERLAQRLRGLPYLNQFTAAFGIASAHTQALALMASQAIERFEQEDPSFHPYSSRFDRYLRGTAFLSAQEQAGLNLFVDPEKGNCSACHTVATGPQGRAPDFTDYSFHALGVPRNAAIPANRDSTFFDLGLCGPRRLDMRGEKEYCGYFKTPTLRNVARRSFFFHNGRFTNLSDVLHFYVERDTDPRRWYSISGGRVHKFDDLPQAFIQNVDLADAPLNRQVGDVPALNDTQIAQLVSFLRTLSDAN